MLVTIAAVYTNSALPAAVTTTMLLATATLMASLTAGVIGPIRDIEITDLLPVLLARLMT